MKAVRFSRFGPPAEVAELVDLPEPPPPAAGEVAVEIEACSINPADLLMFEGRYGARPTPLPAFAGGEAVGRVREVGAGVAHLQAGDRVLVLLAQRGNWRERATVKAERLFALPAVPDPRQLAMLAVNPPTAWLMLHEFVALRPGDWVIQDAANSAVGQYLVRIARTLGLHTANVVRRADAAASLKNIGADAVLVDGPDLATRVAAAVGKGAVRLGIDAVGGEATRRLAKCVADGGTVVNYGLLSGEACRIDAADIVFRDVSLRGFWLARWLATRQIAEIRALYERLAAQIADGTLKAEIEATYPLSRVREALAHAARGGRGGKILLTADSGGASA
jgi:NADPH:quinone reductase-like Zn-dependent oxidoreductase